MGPGALHRDNKIWLSTSTIYIGPKIIFNERPWQYCTGCIPVFIMELGNVDRPCICPGGRRSPAVACWASDHWVASSNPLRGKFCH